MRKAEYLVKRQSTNEGGQSIGGRSVGKSGRVREVVEIEKW